MKRLGMIIDRGITWFDKCINWTTLEKEKAQNIPARDDEGG